MCPSAASRWLAHSVAVFAGLEGSEVEGKFRGQDKGERCAEPSTLGWSLVLQGFLGRCREVYENRARWKICANTAHTPHCCTSRVISP
jgi:hypothetical protein